MTLLPVRPATAAITAASIIGTYLVRDGLLQIIAEEIGGFGSGPLQVQGSAQRRHAGSMSDRISSMRTVPQRMVGGAA